MVMFSYMRLWKAYCEYLINAPLVIILMLLEALMIIFTFRVYAYLKKRIKLLLILSIIQVIFLTKGIAGIESFPVTGWHIYEGFVFFWKLFLSFLVILFLAGIDYSPINSDENIAKKRGNEKHCLDTECMFLIFYLLVPVTISTKNIRRLFWKRFWLFWLWFNLTYHTQDIRIISLIGVQRNRFRNFS